MQITRLHEDPRVTRPYSDEQWTSILALGDRIDEEFAAGDVRLTVGGPPSCPSTTWTVKSGTPRRWVRPNNGGMPAPSFVVCATPTRRWTAALPGGASVVPRRVAAALGFHVLLAD